MSRRRIATLTTTATLALTGTMGSSAQAVYHENMITEVHQGVVATGDFVELQAFSAGQNLVGGHYLITYDGANNPQSTFQFPGNVSNGANQATILVANDASVPGADFIAPGGLNVVNLNGAACFVDTTVPLVGIDCVDWGPPMGGTLPSPAGTPVPSGLPDNGSFSRGITRGCTTALDPADDTNDSATDFALAAPSPRGNAVPPIELPCAPCKSQTATMVGTEGPDTLTGTNGKDVVSALGGNDTVKGLNGKDVLCGGGGKDKLFGGGSKDTLLGGAGKDKLSGGGAKDKLLGQGGKDTCKGGKGEDTAKKCEVERSI